MTKNIYGSINLINSELMHLIFVASVVKGKFY